MQEEKKTLKNILFLFKVWSCGEIRLADEGGATKLSPQSLDQPAYQVHHLLRHPSQKSTNKSIKKTKKSETYQKQQLQQSKKQIPIYKVHHLLVHKNNKHTQNEKQEHRLNSSNRQHTNFS